MGSTNNSARENQSKWRNGSLYDDLDCRNYSDLITKTAVLCVKFRRRNQRRVINNEIVIVNAQYSVSDDIYIYIYTSDINEYSMTC